MAKVKQRADAPQALEAGDLAHLFQDLVRRGYDVIGPTVRDGAIVLDHLESAEQLPAGWTDEQSPGHYRLKSQESGAFFDYAVGPHSWKKFLHPAEIKIWSAERQNGTFRILNNETKPKRPFALFGVRACDLAAIAVQDRVLTQDKYHDPIYSGRRNGAFIVVVQCTRSVETCFCASLGTGPRPKHEFDLSLTELIGSDGHWFLVHAGSKLGSAVLADLPTSPATEEQIQQESQAIDAATCQQVRSVDTSGLKELLYQNFENSRWEQVAERCLTCANCTMVCPTCFCTTVEDASDLTGTHAERWRRWDSCFTLSFSYIHGGNVRASGKARYRQWLTHKLGSWIDQFGTLGCVGCGRCITWCPKGIDITEEARALREGGNNGKP
ncbi:MAG TPA: 4Fe-4S dicluster domain-containing protein [Candidatus Sulfotelmatobacter sp.]|nr:4Fe-4S dicluster domain-containing protein [Candidatus Sulfotelmatobacter sp.]